MEGCLALRNLLRRETGLGDEYGAHKLALTTQDHESIDAYATAKSEILQRILAKAGLDPEELATIDRANRIPR